MEIPRFWVKVSGEPPSGRPPRVDVWGWSSASEADALAVAQQRLTDVIAAAEARGGLPRRADYYPRIPLREPVIAEVHDDGGELLGVVTRNRYGADVLNTDRLLIADVDVPEWERHEPGARRGLFGRRIPSEDGALSAVHTVAHRNGDLGWHWYRTRAGLRLLVTGDDLSPGSPRAADLLDALGSDPLYRQLTRTYDSFRARLSPKPWRIGMAALPVSARVPNGPELLDDPAWLAEYDRRSAEYAVCRLVERSGLDTPAPLDRLVALHDRLSGVGRDAPLA